MFTQRFPLAVSSSFYLVTFSAKLLFFPLGAVVSVRGVPLWSAIISRYSLLSAVESKQTLYLRTRLDDAGPNAPQEAHGKPRKTCMSI
jgi:hypothetical protein